jgi:hypothetical protein
VTLEPIAAKISKQLMRLPPGAQRRVLAFAEGLEEEVTRGATGAALLRLAGTLSSEDARQIRDAIEEGCEAIEPKGW